jgi:hypothetical protein
MSRWVWLGVLVARINFLVWPILVWLSFSHPAFVPYMLAEFLVLFVLGVRFLIFGLPQWVRYVIFLETPQSQLSNNMSESAMWRATVTVMAFFFALPVTFIVLATSSGVPAQYWIFFQIIRASMFGWLYQSSAACTRFQCW